MINQRKYKPTANNVLNKLYALLEKRSGAKKRKSRHTRCKAFLVSCSDKTRIILISEKGSTLTIVCVKLGN